MMEKVYKERAFFLSLYNTPHDKALRRALVKKMTFSQAKALALVALNVLHGAIGIDGKKKKVLAMIKPFLCSVSREGLSTRKRKKILVKKVHEACLLVKLLYRNLDLLIWRDASMQRRAKSGNSS